MLGSDAAKDPERSVAESAAATIETAYAFTTAMERTFHCCTPTHRIERGTVDSSCSDGVEFSQRFTYGNEIIA